MGTALAPIKHWKPWHEQIVALHILRWSNERLAKQFDKTPVRISQIINDPKSQAIIRASAARIREQVTGGVEEGLVDLSEHALKRLETTIQEENFLPGTDAKKHQDNMSLSILKGVGYLPGSQTGDGEKTKAPMSPALAERMVKAMEQSAKASEIANEREEEEGKEGEIVVEKAVEVA